MFSQHTQPSGAMNESAGPLEILNSLASKNIGWSLDDFGTDYSSLSYLTRFPIHHLKIDRSFIDQVPGHAPAKLLVAAIVSMAHALQLRVIAEGVETEQQRLFLSTRGCEELQGSLFSRRIAESAFLELIRGYVPRPASSITPMEHRL